MARLLTTVRRLSHSWRRPTSPRVRNLRAQIWIQIWAFFLGFGCQLTRPPGQSSTPGLGAAYPFQSVKGPSVEEEIAFYESRCKQRPQSSSDRAFLAQAYLTKAQAEDNDELFSRALKTAEDSLKMLPEGNKTAEFVLAGVAEGHHNFRQAYEISLKIYQADPNEMGTYSMISNSLLEMGRLAEAERWAAPLRQSSTAGACVHMARIAIYQGKDPQAEALLERALELEQPQERKTSARIRSLLGDIALRHGQLAKAGEYLDQSLQIQRRSLPALLCRARLARRQGQPEQALQLLSEAHAFFQNPALLTEMASLHQQLGRTSEAVALQDRAAAILRQEVGHGMIGHARDLARVLLDQGKAREAIKVMLEEQKYRQDHRSFELLAQAYLADGRPKEALRAIEQALAGGYQDPAVFSLASRIASKASDPRGADWAEAARRLDPGFELP